jgi:hypothetical protein
LTTAALFFSPLNGFSEQALSERKLTHYEKKKWHIAPAKREPKENASLEREGEDTSLDLNRAAATSPLFSFCGNHLRFYSFVLYPLPCFSLECSDEVLSKKAYVKV